MQSARPSLVVLALQARRRRGLCIRQVCRDVRADRRSFSKMSGPRRAGVENKIKSNMAAAMQHAAARQGAGSFLMFPARPNEHACWRVRTRTRAAWVIVPRTVASTSRARSLESEVPPLSNGNLPSHCWHPSLGGNLYFPPSGSKCSLAATLQAGSTTVKRETCPSCPFPRRRSSGVPSRTIPLA